MSEITLRVLIIEDDEDDYFLAKEYLSEIRSARISVSWVSSYESALEAVAKREHDVCLLDYRLGAGSGLELLRGAILEGATAPIILLTGQDDAEIDIEALRAGAADYLCKSRLSSQLLERAIRYALERARILETLRLSEERYALACAGANDGLWDWNLDTNRIYYSPRWKSMLGYRDAEVGDSAEEWFGRVHVEDLPGLVEALEQNRESSDSHFEWEYRMRHKSGEWRWMLTRGLATRDGSGAGGRGRLAGSQTDVTSKKEVEERLIHDALHDALTGLPNRLLFMNRLGHMLAKCSRDPDLSFAVLFMDLDRFKVINDTLGHLIGDRLLIETGRRLKSITRPGDTAARLGGDEFTILLENVDGVEGAVSVAERVIHELASPFLIEHQEIHTHGSIGIALGPSDYQRSEDILRDADLAMYRAKSDDGRRYQIFDKSMYLSAIDAMKLENEFRLALGRDEFDVHLQPILDLRTREIRGFEALARWNHPQRGLLSPASFIEIAEESGLIHPFGEVILRESCRRFTSWLDRYPIPARPWLSVNISAKQFGRVGFASKIEDVLAETGMPASLLHLEITETAVMKDLDTSLRVLERLRKFGVGLSIDDFGTGHSSLSHLQRFPAEFLKIDKSFIRRVTTASKDFELVRVIVWLGRSLGMQVIAEGVETVEQEDLLKSVGCDFGQGYLFARPLAREVIESLFEQMSRGQTRVSSAGMMEAPSRHSAIDTSEERSGLILRRDSAVSPGPRGSAIRPAGFAVP